MRLLALPSALVAVLAVAGCGGSSPGDTVVAGGEPTVVVEAPAATATSSVTSTAAPAVPAASARGASSSSPGSARRTTGAAAGGRPASPGAAPGTYPVHLSLSSSSASGYDGPGTLGVDPAAADGTQAQTLTEEGRSEGSTTTYRYLADGEVAILATGGRGSAAAPGCEAPQLTFSPPIEAVPPSLAVGETWSGSFSGGGVDGSYTAAVTGQGSDTVGGIGVAVWRLHGSLDISGRICGTQFRGTVTLDSDWAPSLRLVIASVETTDATALGFHATGRSAFELLSTTPS